MSRNFLNRAIKIIVIFLSVISMSVIVYMSFNLGYEIGKRNHGKVYIYDKTIFTETTEVLINPNRGFYYMYGFYISDGKFEDYNARLAQAFVMSQAHSLIMIQINLQEYAQGPISEEGLEKIHNLFMAMSCYDKQYLVRFLYDWEGKNPDVEPQEVEIVLGHMDQLKGVLCEFNDIVFVHQGLFIGNWGEMNGTIHLNSMQDLAEKLLEVTDNNMYLSVRMPAQWRKITQITEPNISGYSTEHISRRMGLFNDGMMGSYSDYGTYGNESREKVGDYSYWNRTEELLFQEELCKYVPNGGEVIIDNVYNDFTNALQDLKQMHITYLNFDYDRDVLEKWKNHIVSDQSIYNGMNGLTYIERHLGYRLLIRNVDLQYKEKDDILSVQIDLQNVGFAPVYKATEMHLYFVNLETKECQSCLVEADIHELTGGNNENDILTIIYEQNISGLTEGMYEVYFRIKDVDSGLPIYLANEQEVEEYGYKLGTIYIENLKTSIENYLNKLFDF